MKRKGTRIAEIATVVLFAFFVLLHMVALHIELKQETLGNVLRNLSQISLDKYQLFSLLSQRVLSVEDWVRNPALLTQVKIREHRELVQQIETRINDLKTIRVDPEITRLVAETSDFSRRLRSFEDWLLEKERRGSPLLAELSIYQKVLHLLNTTVTNRLGHFTTEIAEQNHTLGKLDRKLMVALFALALLSMLVLATWLSIAAEEKVSGEYLKNVIQSMKDALVVLSSKGSIQAVNTVFLTLTEHEEKEVLGKSIYSYFIPASKHELREMLVAGAPVEEKELILLSRTGNHIPVTLSTSWMPTRKGTPASLVCVARTLVPPKPPTAA